MSVLRVLLTLVDDRLFGKIRRAVNVRHVRPDHLHRVVGNARGIGTHVGDQTDAAFFCRARCLRTSRCASIIVFFTVKRSLRAASCWSLLVMNGGTGLRFFSFVTTDSTLNGAFFRPAECDRLRAWFVTSAVLPLIFASLASNCGGLAFEPRGDRPVFFGLECQNLALAFHDQAQARRFEHGRRKFRGGLCPTAAG